MFILYKNKKLTKNLLTKMEISAILTIVTGRAEGSPLHHIKRVSDPIHERL